MTWEEAIEKYGDVKVKFSSYFKYTFTYSGLADDGTPISCSFGGDPHDIYRMSIEADKLELLRDVATRSICIGKTGDANYAFISQY